MVPPSSIRVSRAPTYSMTIVYPSPTGLSPSMVARSRAFDWFNYGFRLVRLRSPLLTESRLISFPPGTEMFQFPGFALPALYIQTGVTESACAVRTGCPIQKSSDQSLVGSSPRHIAASYVFHRLCTPRHPPCTLDFLSSRY